MRIPRILEDFLGHVEAHPLRALYFFSWVGMAIAKTSLWSPSGTRVSPKRRWPPLLLSGPLLFFPATGACVADRFGRPLHEVGNSGVGSGLLPAVLGAWLLAFATHDRGAGA